MKNSVALLFLLACCSTLFVGCASGPRYSEMSASLPALPPDSGRIYFYRKSVMGAAVQPTVKLNGEAVGTAAPGGFFYVDRPAGNYTIETTTEVKRELGLTLDKGQQRYVRFNIALGFFIGHVYPELIEDEKGKKEIASCHYTGPR